MSWSFILQDQKRHEHVYYWAICNCDSWQHDILCSYNGDKEYKNHSGHIKKCNLSVLHLTLNYYYNYSQNEKIKIKNAALEKSKTKASLIHS